MDSFVEFDKLVSNNLFFLVFKVFYVYAGVMHKSRQRFADTSAKVT